MAGKIEKFWNKFRRQRRDAVTTKIIYTDILYEPNYIAVVRSFCDRPLRGEVKRLKQAYIPIVLLRNPM